MNLGDFRANSCFLVDTAALHAECPDPVRCSVTEKYPGIRTVHMPDRVAAKYRKNDDNVTRIQPPGFWIAETA